MRSGWISGVCALACGIWWAGCGSSGTDEPAATGPAGEAVQVAGSVSVVHEGAEQPLIVGAKVFGTDEIVTGADGAVTIRLFHNEARWTLESGKRKRVDTSLAWTAPTQVGGGVLAGGDTTASTAAAGRHAEKEAADTRATAALSAQRESSEASEAAAAKAEAMATRETPPAPVTVRPSPPSPDPAPPPPVVKKPRRTAHEVGAPGGGSKTGTADHVSDIAVLSVTSDTMRTHQKAFQACYKSALKTHPDLSGRIVIEFVVAADGTVRIVRTRPTPELRKTVEPCVRKAFAQVKFPARPDGKDESQSFVLQFKAQ